MSDDQPATKSQIDDDRPIRNPDPLPAEVQAPLAAFGGEPPPAPPWFAEAIAQAPERRFVDSLGSRLDKPVLIVHSEAAAVPQGAHAFFSRLTGEASELWLDNVSQFDFYDNPPDVSRAADAAARHFRRINAQ